MQDMQELAATSAARGDTPPAHAPVWTVDIWRGADEGEFVSYEVPRNERQTVLDVVSWVQRHRAPELAYRFACRVGMCGVCAVKLLLGQVTMDEDDGLDPDDRAAGKILACQAKATGDVAVEA